MRLAIQTWNGHAINDTTNYESVIDIAVPMPSATATFIDLGIKDPALAGKVLDGGYFTFTIVLRGTGEMTVEQQRDELNGWFQVSDPELHQLIAYDIDNSNKSWYLEGFVVSPPTPNSSTKYKITLALSKPYWIESEQQVDIWNVSTDTETESITVAGNVKTLPVITLVPTNQRDSDGFAHRTFVAVHTSGWSMNELSVNIAGSGGLDTATLISDGKIINSDCGDLWVSVNSVYQLRSIADENTDHTKIWVKLKLSPAPVMTLKTSIAGSGVPATIECEYTGTNQVILPQNGTLQIGSEIFTYSAYVIQAIASKNYITFTTTERNAKNSSIASHSTSTSVYWIENEIWLLYGNSVIISLPLDPAGYDSPAFNLSMSDNDLHIYEAFGEISGVTNLGFFHRMMAPVKSGGTGIDWSHYYGVEDGTTVFPFVAIGLKNILSANNTTNYYNYNYASWGFYHAGGYSEIIATGEKWLSSTSLGWVSRCMISDKPDGTGIAIHSIPAPSPLDTWDAISFTESIASNPQNIYFVMTGEQKPTPDAKAELQTVTLTVNDPPVVTLIGVDQTNYTIKGYLKNNTNGQIIFFNDIVAKIDEAITIDCENQEIYGADGKRLRGMISFGGDKRNEWLELEYGANELEYSDTGTGSITITTYWNGKNTL